MKRDLPTWPEERAAAGRRLAESWETFFASRDSRGEGAGGETLEDEAGAVMARNEEALLRYPNVVGVAVGVRTRRGGPTGERCLVVYVERKVPESELGDEGTLPREVEGVPVDVVEVGRIRPLPS